MNLPLLPPRAFLLTAALAAAPAVAALPVALTTTAARADTVDTSFLQTVSQRLVATVNGSGSHADKVAAVLAVVDRDVAVDLVGQSCLGRYWRTATPAQRQRYLKLFHQVLANSISNKLGAYEGLSLAIGQSEPRADGTYVHSTLTRPGQNPASVLWKVNNVGGQPKIEDVVVEGVSLVITQRQDYASFLSSHGGNVDALLDALDRQVARNG